MTFLVRYIPLLLAALLLAGCTTRVPPDVKVPVGDSDGDGIPDVDDEFPSFPNWGVNLTYLDDTMEVPGEWHVTISSTTDRGVLLVDNSGMVDDTIELEVLSQPEGWSVNLERSSVELDNATIEPVVVTYDIPDGASTGPVVIEGRSSGALRETVSNITLICDVEGTQGHVTDVGDMVSVDYTLWDTSGTELDSGTLPATAGEKYVGPMHKLGYITGFYMGLLGMKKPQGLLAHGETKVIRVPPELAYGTDPAAHELGGQVLIFRLELRKSTGIGSGSSSVSPDGYS